MVMPTKNTQEITYQEWVIYDLESLLELIRQVPKKEPKDHIIKPDVSKKKVGKRRPQLRIQTNVNSTGIIDLTTLSEDHSDGWELPEERPHSRKGCGKFGEVIDTKYDIFKKGYDIENHDSSSKSPRIEKSLKIQISPYGEYREWEF